jgi:cytochrome c556
MTRKRLTIVLSAAVLTAIGYIGVESLIGGARADDLQTVVDTRRATMKDIGAQTKAIYAVVDAKSGDMADMQKRALQIQADAANLETQAGKLAAAAQGGDMAAFSAQFAVMGKACGTCHTDFRAKLN